MQVQLKDVKRITPLRAAVTADGSVVTWGTDNMAAAASFLRSLADPSKMRKPWPKPGQGNSPGHAQNEGNTGP